MVSLQLWPISLAWLTHCRSKQCHKLMPADSSNETNRRCSLRPTLKHACAVKMCVTCLATNPPLHISPCSSLSVCCTQPFPCHHAAHKNDESASSYYSGQQPAGLVSIHWHWNKAWSSLPLLPNSNTKSHISSLTCCTYTIHPRGCLILLAIIISLSILPGFTVPLKLLVALADKPAWKLEGRIFGQVVSNEASIHLLV